MFSRILVVCTANRCRSPMAGALLARRFADAGRPVDVVTAGLLDGGQPLASAVPKALARQGVAVDSLPSRRLTVEMIESSGLVVAMERAHVRAITVLAPDAWARTFTFKELVRRGEHVGRREPDEQAEDWLAALHRGRRRDDLLGEDPADDLADPMGRGRRAFDRTAAELDDLVRRLVALLDVGSAERTVDGAHAHA